MAKNCVANNFHRMIRQQFFDTMTMASSITWSFRHHHVFHKAPFAMWSSNIMHQVGRKWYPTKINQKNHKLFKNVFNWLKPVANNFHSVQQTIYLCDISTVSMSITGSCSHHFALQKSPVVMRSSNSSCCPNTVLKIKQKNYKLFLKII